MKRLCFLILAVAFIIVVFPRTAAAEIDYKYELNFDRQYHNNTWNELRVTVQNPDGPDFLGTVEVELGSRYVKEVFVAEGSAVTVYFYLPPRNIIQSFFQDYDGVLRIRLKDHQQRTVKLTQGNFSEKNEMGLLMGVLTAHPDRFNRLTNLTPDPLISKSAVITLEDHHFNHYPYMDNFAVIIISDAGTEQLTAEQQENLTRWVANGGLLVVGGGRGWQNNKAFIPSPVLPFTPTGTVETGNLTPLADRVKLTEITDSRFLLTTGQMDPASNILLEAAEGPLLISGSYGRGQVIYSTLNLEDPPFNHALNFESFWGYILDQNRGNLFKTSGVQEHWGFTQFVSSLALDNADLVFLSPFKLFSGLLFYILLVGPVSYFILKRRQKWEWSWFTIPALAIIFTGTIYAAGSSGRQSELTHYQVNIYDIYQGNQASVESYSGLFIPRRGNLEFSTGCPALAAGKGAVLSAGTALGETGVRIPNPPLWSIQRFYAREMAVLDGPIELTITADQSGGTVTVTNNSGLEMFDSYARLGDEWLKTGPLASGQSKTVSPGRGERLDTAAILEHYQSSPGKRGMPYHGYSLEEIFPGGLQWIGFNDDQYPFQLGDKINAVPLNIFRVSCEPAQIEPAPEFNLPEGWSIPQLSGFGGDSQDEYMDMGRYKYGGSGYERYFYGRGWVDLLFTLPPGIDYTSGAYELNFSPTGGSGYLDVQVFNHHRREWQPLGEFRVGGGYGSGNFKLTDLDQIIADDRLLIRVNYDGEVWFQINRILSIQGGKLK